MFFFNSKRQSKNNTAAHEAALARSKDIDNIANYETAVASAKGCRFDMRAGDPVDNFSVFGVGIRVMVLDFGQFQPFIFSEQTKGWLQEHFELTDRQTSKVFTLLQSRLNAYLRDQESAVAKDYRLGKPLDNRFSWLSTERGY